MSASRSPSPRQMLPIPGHHHHHLHSQHAQQHHQQHQQQVHFIQPSHYSLQKVQQADADATQAYTAFYPARIQDSGGAAVTFGNHVAAAQPCVAPGNGMPALAAAPIQVAGILEPGGQMPVLAPAGSANGQQLGMPHRHLRHTERYAPYSTAAHHHHHHTAQPAALAVSQGGQTPSYEQATTYMNGGGGGGGAMQPTPSSPQQTLESQSGSHFSPEDQAAKQQQQQQQQSMGMDYPQYSPDRHFKARRRSEVAHTPDGMEHHGNALHYGDMAGPSQSHVSANQSSAFMTPPPTSATNGHAGAPQSLPVSGQYDESKHSGGGGRGMASTPHQYVSPPMMGYEKTEQGDQVTTSSPSTHMHPDSSLWQPMNSMGDGYEQHVSAPITGNDVYAPRSGLRRQQSETLPSPSASSHDAEDCSDSCGPSRYLPARGQKLKASDEFTTVPGRLSLLGSASKYVVSIGEIQRRLAPPECLNASLLGGVLRKAKARNGGTDLRKALEDIGLHLPPGRRKAAGTSMLTSLVEEESRSLASQFNGICRKMFPTAELATSVCRQHSASVSAHSTSQHHAAALAEERQHAIKNAMQLTSELTEQLQAYLEQEEADRDNENVNFPGLRQFSLITHSFGVLVVHGVMQVFQGYLNNLMKTTSGVVIRDHALQHQPSAAVHRKGHSTSGHSMLKQHR